MASTSATMAIKKFFEAEPNGSKLGMTELKDFKAVCTDEEWQKFSQDAADFLGLTLTEKKAA